jgi:hypothetical protein
MFAPSNPAYPQVRREDLSPIKTPRKSDQFHRLVDGWVRLLPEMPR